MRCPPLLPILTAIVLAGPALAQPAPAPDSGVRVEELTVLDIFSSGVPGTGFDKDVWKGTPAPLARRLIPAIAEKPLSPAANLLARRLLLTGATAPEGAGADAALAGARAQSLVALGAAAEIGPILDHATGLSTNPALSQAGAEAALIRGDDARACAIADALATGRDGVYWIRLRAFCLATVAAQPDAALLTQTLAQQTQRDAVFGRLMDVLLAGRGSPGAASARNGIDLALSRKLSLDLGPALAAAPLAVAAPLASDARQPEDVRAAAATRAAALGLRPLAPSTPDAVAAAVRDRFLSELTGDRAAFDALFAAMLTASAAERPALQARVYLLICAGRELSAQQQADSLGMILPPGRASAAQLFSLDLYARTGAKGATALVALAISSAAGPQGLALADRGVVVSALHRAGMDREALDFALEGLPAPVP